MPQYEKNAVKSGVHRCNSQSVIQHDRCYAADRCGMHYVSGHRVALSNAHADQIAALLNERNQLTVRYTRQRVLENAENYVCRYSEAGEVVACVEVRRVQWYQAEVLHLTVAKSQERKGHAKALLCEAERVGRANGARVLQCTIRQDNTASLQLFEGFGFSHVVTFHNQGSGNNVAVLQKVLANAR
jgi:ribosomal protein S18 acetylase RimI-like enzyme